MNAFVTSLIFVVLAEMGDKTQLLAMCFAMKYRWQTVMWGVFWATAANHLMAAAVGDYLTTLIPLDYIKIAAAVSFVIFGLWTIRGDTLDCDPRQSKYGPFWTVAIAFFIAEMGDKTQLATITLAADFQTVIPVWIGTTAGMLIANAIGIIVGVVSGRRIPERAVKWFAAIVFIVFGIYGLYESVPRDFWRPEIVIGGVITLVLSILAVAWMNRVRAQATGRGRSEAGE